MKDAIELCQERGFFIGDMLVSDEWSYPRKIVAFEKTAVLYKIGTMLDIMATMPADVHRQVLLDPPREEPA